MRYRRAWLALLALAIASPLGVIAAGGAWGEWDLAGIRDLVGHEPAGMRETAARAPEAPIPDYEVPGLAGKPWRKALGTIIAALAGALAAAGASFLITRVAYHGGDH